MQNLKDLELTANDFKLLVDGLDALPYKGQSAEIMGDMMGAALIKDKVELERFMAARDKKRMQADRERETKMEDIRILQGKLLMLKRYMESQDLLKEIGDL